MTPAPAWEIANGTWQVGFLGLRSEAYDEMLVLVVRPRDARGGDDSVGTFSQIFSEKTRSHQSINLYPGFFVAVIAS